MVRNKFPNLFHKNARCHDVKKDLDKEIQIKPKRERHVRGNGEKMIIINALIRTNIIDPEGHIIAKNGYKMVQLSKSSYHNIINEYRLLVLASSSSSNPIIKFPDPIVPPGKKQVIKFEGELKHQLYEINHDHGGHTTNGQFLISALIMIIFSPLPLT
jgi:hypothetical protein